MYTHVADCTTGQQGLVEMTEAEETAHLTMQEQIANQTAYEQHLRAQAAEQRATDIALLAASEDPHHQALARLLGG